MIVIKDLVENVCVLRSKIKIILRVERLLCECRHCRSLRIVRVCRSRFLYCFVGVTLCRTKGMSRDDDGGLFMEGNVSQSGIRLYRGRQSAGPSADAQNFCGR